MARTRPRRIPPDGVAFTLATGRIGHSYNTLNRREPRCAFDECGCRESQHCGGVLQGTWGALCGAKGIYHQEPCAEACLLARLPRRQMVEPRIEDSTPGWARQRSYSPREGRRAIETRDLPAFEGGVGLVLDPARRWYTAAAHEGAGGTVWWAGLVGSTVRAPCRRNHDRQCALDWTMRPAAAARILQVLCYLGIAFVGEEPPAFQQVFEAAGYRVVALEPAFLRNPGNGPGP